MKSSASNVPPFDYTSVITHSSAAKIAETLVEYNRTNFEIDFREESLANLLADAFGELGCEVKRIPDRTSFLVMVDKEWDSLPRFVAKAASPCGTCPCDEHCPLKE